MLFFNFALVFMFSIANIYIANLLYLCILFIEFIKNQGITFIKNKLAIFLYFLFIVWVTLSTLFYNIDMKDFSLRSILQYFFTLQYAVLLLPLLFIKRNILKFENWIYKISVLLGIYIILLYIYIYFTKPTLLLYDLWGVGWIPGWPNSPPLPLLMGLWLAFKNNKAIITKIILFIALYFTQSRLALLGAIIIIFYFLFKHSKSNIKNSVVTIMLVFTGFIMVISIVVFNPEIVRQLLFATDRVDIFNLTWEYIGMRPVFGFGGNSLDQLLLTVDVNYIPFKEWPHTHNWILEMCLRYGIIGGIIFTFFIIALFLGIKNQDKKFMFLLLMVLALFQIYIRDFVFLFYLAYLTIDFSTERKIYNPNDN